MPEQPTPLARLSLDEIDQMTDAASDQFTVGEWCEAACDAVAWARRYEGFYLQSCGEGMALETLLRAITAAACDVRLFEGRSYRKLWKLIDEAEDLLATLGEAR